MYSTPHADEPRAPGETAEGAALRDYLFGLTLHGIKLGFDNINALLDAAGHPEQQCPAIHVAGTNGKGSVTAMLDAMLRAAGYRVCRFTSPHILDVRERFLENAAPIPEEALLENITFFRNAAQSMPNTPTFFEMCTAIAFRYFAQCRAEAAVIEVGMGGRLDATNVISPAATAITNIDLEHTQYLGNTLAAIAFEKAGVLKPGVPAVIGERREEPLSVILERAAALGCPTTLLGRDFDYTLEGSPWNQRFSYTSPALTLDAVPLRLAGRCQGENAAVATALAEALRPAYPKLTAAAIRQGLAEARWPCRLERVLEAGPNSPPVIIDVAHNVAGIRRLAETFDGCTAILAVSSDKDAASMVAALSDVASCIILTVFNGKRSFPLEELSAAAGPIPHQTARNLQEAIALGMAHANPNRPLLITGSIYTAGEARALLIKHHGAPPLEF